MRLSIIVILILLIASLSYADTFKIYYDCFPREVQKIFKDNGFNLDLDANDRTPNSWGFIRSEGEWFSINSYKPATAEEMEKLRIIISDYMAGKYEE